MESGQQESKKEARQSSSSQSTEEDERDEGSIFQGDNQIFHPQTTAANIEHQNPPDAMSSSDSAKNIAANIKSNENPSDERVDRPVPVDDSPLEADDQEDDDEEEGEGNQVLTDDERSDETPRDSDEPCTSGASLNTRAVNILPVNRSLIDYSSNNLIAIGRKPQLPTFAIQKRKAAIRSSQIDRTNNTLGWQAENKTLKERIAHMYCNETLADVFFVVGSDSNRQTIPAHKFVLSIGSVVFDAMFNGGLTPNNTNEPLEIELPDVEPYAFMALLKFLYSDEVSIGPESVMTTLYTAKKYAVPAMETACVDFLKESLGADNAFMLLSQAKLFDEPQLQKLCLELIDRKTIEALNGEGFTDIDLGTLCDVLKRDTLRVKELHLFQATLRWACAECDRRGMSATAENKRAVLEHALQLIRFPLMKIDEFALHVEPTSLLSDREMNKIFKYLAVNPSDRPIIAYSDRPRSLIMSQEMTVSRFQRTDTRWGYCGTPDRIKFTVDRRIYVIGFGLYGHIHVPQEYMVQIKIIHCGTSKTLAENNTSFVCDGSPNPCRVCFKEPVEIIPGVTYIASALMRGPDSYYGTKGLRRVVTCENGVTFQFTYAAMNNNGTSVEDGQIPEIVFYPMTQ